MIAPVVREVVGACAHCGEPLFSSGPVARAPLAHVGCARLATVRRIEEAAFRALVSESDRCRVAA